MATGPGSQGIHRHGLRPRGTPRHHAGGELQGLRDAGNRDASGLLPLKLLHQPIERPPSTAKIGPVTYSASRTRYMSAPDTSSGEPLRFSAVASRMDFLVAASMGASGHSPGPGA